MKRIIFKMREGNKNTSKKTWMGKLLLTAKVGGMVLGMLALISMPQMVQSVHAQAHSDHFHAYTTAMTFLAEQENKTNEQSTYVNKDSNTNTKIVLADQGKRALTCPEKTDATDKK